jgi:trans-aconitate 2-methyltransferase
MGEDPAKDFGPIADDYAFFETHSTEAEEDSRAYVERLASILPAAGEVRLLDFGCGSGSFAARFLQRVSWPPERLRLTLVEPVEAARRQAVARLGRYTLHPVSVSATLPHGTASVLDIVLANHVLYYVPELPSQLASLIGALAPAGVFATAIAPRTNPLIEFWISGFRLLGRDVPYNTSEDVEASLERLGTAYQKDAVPYRLEFRDTEENRMRIMSFLFAEHLTQMPKGPLLDLFEQYARLGWITIQTASDHYTVRDHRHHR